MRRDSLMIKVELFCNISCYFYHSSDCCLRDVAGYEKSSTFAPELIRELF